MKRFALYAVTISIFSLLAGCGGGDDDPNAGLPIVPVVSPTPTVSAYAGTYNSTVALPDGRSGAVALTVGADNRATGSLTVTESARSRQATAFSFGAGTYSISGTIDPTTGAFTMTGTLPGSGSFTFSGTLPTPGNGNVGGSYTLTAGGQTYTGSFGTPVVPSPTPSPSPGASPTPPPTPSGAESVNLIFSNANGVNIDVSPLTETDAARSRALVVTQGSLTQLSVGAGKITGGILRAAGVVLTNQNGTISTGDVFSASSSSAMGVATVSQYTQGTGTVSYISNGGTITVVSLTATSVTVRLDNVTFADQPGTTGTGSFTLNGEITSDID